MGDDYLEDVRREALKQLPEFAPVLERDEELWPHKHILDSLAFFVMSACAKDASPGEPGPEFMDLDDLLSRALGFIESLAVTNSLDTMNEIEKQFIETLFLLAPPSYFKIKSLVNIHNSSGRTKIKCMIMRYEHLQKHPSVFKSMTGLRLSEFEGLVKDILPLFLAAEQQRLGRPDRQRAVGGGLSPVLDGRDQVLMTVVWLRVYPTNEVLGYLFGVSDSTTSRVMHRVLPLLEQAGRDTMRMPDPGRKRRKHLDELLVEVPELAVVIDSFEQKVQRPPDDDQQRGYFSGKKKIHTLKSQVAVDEETSLIIDVSESVPGPTADITLLDQSGLFERLPEGLAALADAAYKGSLTAIRALIARARNQKASLVPHRM